MWSRPPLVRVRARGSASRAEGWSPPVSGFFDGFFWQPQGHRDPLGLFYTGRGRFICPLRPFFTRTCLLFPRPRFFFFVFFLYRPSRPAFADSLTMIRRMPRNSLKATLKPTPSPPLLGFGLILGGNAVHFFSGAVFREIPLIVLSFLYSSTLSPSLRSGFCGKFSGANKLWVFGTCARLMYFGAVSCLCFCFIMWCYSPESCLKKFS